jgi:ppGpp synthetase/RelA/SpoT-type nucleotidyltranferase
MTPAVLWWKKVSDAVRQQSHNQLNRAGLVIRDAESRNREVNQAFDTIGEWRSAHSHALREVYEVLEQRAKALDPSAIVSLRLKRIPAMRTKLCRPENRNMKLATMQDIAGCRAVLDDLADVHRLAAQYSSKPTDYIAVPKPDGYRSVHFIEHHHGCQIEIQIRSGLQHAWAAAVETVDFTLGQKLKTGGGTQEWKEFFRLASSAIALSEHSPLVPNTPTDRKTLSEELRKISDKTNALHFLKGIHLIPYSAKNAFTRERGAAYLVTLDMTDEVKVQSAVRVYQEDQLTKANQDYINLEKEFSGDGRRQALLLSVEQVSHVEPAYPAYFPYAMNFRWVLQKFISTHYVQVVLGT